MSDHIFKNAIVFYIEDEKEINRTISNLLKLAFPKLHQFENPLPVLEMIADSTIPDLIITDITLPQMDGFEMIHAIREQGINTPIIVTSGNQQEEYQDQLDQLNIFSYIKKPINLIDLINISQDAIEKSHQGHNV